MFHGSIPDDMRKILFELTQNWGVSDIYVGCSGNFTVERVLAEHKNCRIHGNDVTIYSAAIGNYLARQDMRIELKEEFRDLLGWIEPYLLEGQAGQTATIMMMTNIGNMIGPDGEWKDNRYYQRMLTGFKNQFPDLFIKTTEKLESIDFELASYYSGDVVPFLETLPKEAGVISYPPFFSGDYENMFKKLDLVFDWDKPEYGEIGDGDLDGFINNITDRKFWAFGSNREWNSLDKNLCGITQTTNRGMPLYIYASRGFKRIVLPKQSIEPVFQERLAPQDDIGETMALHILSEPQFRGLRSQYMNEHIKAGQSSMSIAVTVDGRLIGVYAFSVAPSIGAKIGDMYMLSDFAIAPTKYKRLSKLVLYAALSHESKLLAEKIANKRIRNLATTAFSKRPIRMKYRGVFDLVKRTEQGDENDSDHSSQPYKLQYKSKMGRWSLSEGLAEWKTKHGKHIHG